MAAPQPSLLPPATEKTRKISPNLEIWVVSVVLMVATAFAGITQTQGRAWILVLLCMLAFMLFLGKWICGRPLGILITDRNLMSLSRFQMILWTLLILSAYLTMVMQRIHGNISSALDIGIDGRLWALMGISTASLVGSPLLLQNKKLQDPPGSAIEKASKLLQEDQQAIQSNREGRLYSNTSPLDARFTDIFQGDEVGNTAYIDPAKLQMFFFSLIVAASYAYQIFHSMYNDPKNLTIPTVSEGMVALLGISHAGYLGSKTVS